MELKPDDIVKAFDECREYIFGYGLGRDNPHKEDKATADRWIKDGLNLVVAVMVFYEQMNWMHEKFLMFGNGKDRKYLPASLKVFDENIEVAIRRSKNGGQTEFWEAEICKWRARCKGWLKDRRLWQENMWGSQPFEAGNRVPKLVLEEIKQKVSAA